MTDASLAALNAPFRSRTNTATILASCDAARADNEVAMAPVYATLSSVDTVLSAPSPWFTNG